MDGHRLQDNFSIHDPGVHGLTLIPEHLQSTMGRYLARAIRSAMLSDLALQHWQLLTDNILKATILLTTRRNFRRMSARVSDA